jgi:hypothetical protein
MIYSATVRTRPEITVPHNESSGFVMIFDPLTIERCSVFALIPYCGTKD